MVASKRFTTEEIDIASKASILDYVLEKNIGEVSDLNSNYIRLKYKGHDSIIIDRKKNYFIHNANSYDENATGNLINFIQYINDNKVGFREATREALQFVNENKGVIDKKIEIAPESKEFKYSFISAKHPWKTYDYLRKERGLPKDLIDWLRKENYIMQDQKNDVIFHWTRDGKPPKNKEDIIGATQEKTIKKEGQLRRYIVKNSEKDYGFNIHLGNNIEQVYFFESSIDLLSYMAMHPEIDNCHLISLEGVKEKTFYNFLNQDIQKNPEGFNVYIATDNDRAGINFYDNINQWTSEKIKLYNTIPYYYDLNKESFELFKKKALKTEVAMTIALPFYLYERTYIENKEIGFNKEKVQYFENNLELGLQKIKKDYEDSGYDFKVMIQQSSYHISEKERIEDFYNQLTTGKIILSNKNIKDWNDALRETNYQRTPLIIQYVTEDRHYETQHDLIIDSCIKMTEQRKIEYHKQTGIDNDIIDVMAKKGFIREISLNQDIAYIWSKNGQLIGLEVQDITTQDIIGSENNPKKESFIFTIGNPEKMYIFDNPQESLQYWTLHKNHLNNAVMISLPSNNSESKEEYINTKIEEYKEQIKEIVITTKNTKLNKIKPIQNLTIKEERPLIKTWRNDIEKVNEYKEIEHQRTIKKSIIRNKKETSLAQENIKTQEKTL